MHVLLYLDKMLILNRITCTSTAKLIVRASFNFLIAGMRESPTDDVISDPTISRHELF